MATRGQKGGATGAYARTVERTTRPSAEPDHEGFFQRLAARRKAHAAGASEQRLDEIRDNAVTRALNIHR